MQPKSSRGSPRAASLLSDGSADHDAVQLFVVERRLAGMSDRDLTMLQSALLEASTRFAVRGEHVTYLSSMFLPDQHRLLSLFSATNRELVKAVNDASLVPYLGVERFVTLPNPGSNGE